MTLNRITSQMNPVYIQTSCSFKISFNIILPSTPRYPKWALLLRVSDHRFVCISHFTPLASFPGYLILIRLNTPITFDEQHNLRSSALCSFNHPPVTFFLSSPNILFGALFADTFQLHSTPWGQITFNKETKQQRLLVLVFLIVIFLHRRRQHTTIVN